MDLLYFPESLGNVHYPAIFADINRIYTGVESPEGSSTQGPKTPFIGHAQTIHMVKVLNLLGSSPTPLDPQTSEHQETVDALNLVLGVKNSQVLSAAMPLISKVLQVTSLDNIYKLSKNMRAIYTKLSMSDRDLSKAILDAQIEAIRIIKSRGENFKAIDAIETFDFLRAVFETHKESNNFIAAASTMKSMIELLESNPILSDQALDFFNHVMQNPVRNSERIINPFTHLYVDQIASNIDKIYGAIKTKNDLRPIDERSLRNNGFSELIGELSVFENDNVRKHLAQALGNFIADGVLDKVVETILEEMALLNESHEVVFAAEQALNKRTAIHELSLDFGLETLSLLDS